MNLFEEFEQRNVLLRSLMMSDEKSKEDDISGVFHDSALIFVKKEGMAGSITPPPRPGNKTPSWGTNQGKDYLNVCPWHADASPPPTPSRLQYHDDFLVPYEVNPEHMEAGKDVSDSKLGDRDGAKEDMGLIEDSNDLHEQVEERIDFIINNTVARFHRRLVAIEEEFVKAISDVRKVYEKAILDEIQRNGKQTTLK